MHGHITYTHIYTHAHTHSPLDPPRVPTDVNPTGTLVGDDGWVQMLNNTPCQCSIHPVIMLLENESNKNSTKISKQLNILSVYRYA